MTLSHGVDFGVFYWTFLLRLWKCALPCLVLAASGVGLWAQNSSLDASATADPSGFLYEKPAALSASIYSRGSNPPQLLFRFRRTATRSGSTIDVLRDYTYPDGKPAASEHVVYLGNALKLYELNQLQAGSSGSARIVPDPKTPGKSLIVFEYEKKSEASARLSTETLTPDILANDMMGAFLSSLYNQLDQGTKVTCHCLVITRKQSIGFSLVKQSDTDWRGQPAIIVKMQPTSLLVSALVNPLYFTIAKAAPHYVFQYMGRTTPKIREHGHWKDLDAVTVFDW